MKLHSKQIYFAVTVAVFLFFSLGCSVVVTQDMNVPTNSPIFISTPTKRLRPTVPTTSLLPSPLSTVTSTKEILTSDNLLPNKVAYLVAGVQSVSTSNCNAVLLGENGTPVLTIDLEAIFCNSISWSPDGQWLAYSAYKDLPDVPHVFIVNIHTDERKQISNFSIPAIDVVWSPNGVYLTYVEDTESADIINLKLADGNFQKLTDTSGLESNPLWSPDGKQIAFIYRESRMASGYLWIMDAKGNNRKQAFEMPIAISQFSWSPDGTKIVFSSSQECGDLYVFNVLESSIQLTSSDLPICKSNPIWLKDDKIIFLGKNYIGDTATLQRWGIYTINEDGTVVNKILEEQKGIPLSLTFSPVPSLEIGREYLITAAGANLNVRQNASLSAQVLLKLSEKEKIKVLDGPIESDGYYWWQIELSDRRTGWVADVYGWFDPVR